MPRDQPGRRCRVEKRKRVSDDSDSDEDEHELLFASVDNQGNTGCEHVGDQNDRENSNASGSDSGERSNSSSSGGVSDQSSDGGSGSESDDESASSDESDSDDKSDDGESESESDDESDSDGDGRNSSSSRRGKAKAARAKPKAKPKSTSKLPEIQDNDTIIEGRWWKGVPNAAAAPAPRQRPPVAAETTSSPSSTGATAAATAPAISPAAVSSARKLDRGANRTFAEWAQIMIQYTMLKALCAAGVARSVHEKVCDKFNCPYTIGELRGPEFDATGQKNRDRLGINSIKRHYKSHGWESGEPRDTGYKGGKRTTLTKEVKDIIFNVTTAERDLTHAEIAASVQDEINNRGWTMTISPSSVQRALQEMGCVEIKPRYRPELTQKTMKQRLRFAKKYGMRGKKKRANLSKFKHHVWIDYKWFYIYNRRKIKYFPKREGHPQGTFSSSFNRKGHEEKVMFMAATCVPCKEFPDGKVGIYEVARTYTTERGSANRDAGIVCTQDVSANGKFHKKVLEEALLPKLQEKWGKRVKITVQTDNAGAQTGDEAYNAHDKFSNITMLRQPPNSPDFNVLDEGIFHRLQTAVDKERPFFETKNIFYARRQLEECVMNAWDDMTGDQVRTTCEHMNDVFRTVIRLKGGNYYHHASKDE